MHKEPKWEALSGLPLSQFACCRIKIVAEHEMAMTEQKPAQKALRELSRLVNYSYIGREVAKE